MYQAIRTKFLSPTNTLPSRIVVRTQTKRHVYEWDGRLGVPENHRQAAIFFMTLYKWDDSPSFVELVSGWLDTGEGVHVLKFRNN